MAVFASDELDLVYIRDVQSVLLGSGVWYSGTWYMIGCVTSRTQRREVVRKELTVSELAKTICRDRVYGDRRATRDCLSRRAGGLRVRVCRGKPVATKMWRDGLWR